MENNINNKINYCLVLFLILMAVFLLPLINSQQNFIVNSPIDIKLQCIINGSYCSLSSICNVTILYPNNTILANNKLMTNQYSFHNYTITDSSIIGNYLCSASCCDGSRCMSDVNVCDFTISKTGNEITTPQGIIYFVGLILSIIFFILSLYFSIAIPFKNKRNDDGIISINKLKYLKLFMMMTTYVLLLLISAIAYNLTYNYLFLDGVSKIFEWIYWILLSALYPAIVLIFVGIIIFYAEDKILSKKLKRGGFFR
jgi:hypothetical protein